MAQEHKITIVTIKRFINSRKTIFAALLLILLSGLIPNLDSEKYAKYLGPFFINWSDYFSSYSLFRPEIWSFSNGNGLGFPFHYFIWHYNGLDGDYYTAYGLSTVGTLLDLGFYYFLIKLAKKFGNWFLPSLLGLIFVLIGIYGLSYLPFPNRCPYYDDILEYTSSTSPTDLTVTLKNLTDKRLYACKLETIQNIDKNNCINSYKPGDTFKITGMTGLDPAEMCTVKSAGLLSNEFGLGNDECGYTCNILNNSKSNSISNSVCFGKSCQDHCPDSKDDLIYTSIDRKTGAANLINKFDQRKYTCTLESNTSGYNDYDCKSSPQIGTIIHAVAWGEASPATIYNRCVYGQILSFGTKNPMHHNFKQWGDDRWECSYKCKMD